MRGDDGFREFVLVSTPALSRFAYLLTGDHHLAEDLLQSALANTYRHWRRIRDDNPRAYVRRAMVNEHTSWWRRVRVPESCPPSYLRAAPTTRPRAPRCGWPFIWRSRD